jgi:hypothetical protein
MRDMDLAAIDRKSFDSDILATYFFLRFGMAAVAFAFPLLLWLGGKTLMGIPIQTSMSAYYHTDMRDVFVGVLCAVGFSLLYYKGFSRSEDWALNAGGIFALGIAVFPINPTPLFACNSPCDARCLAFSDTLDRTFRPLIASGLHGPCAFAFFFAIAYVCAFCSTSTVNLIPNPAIRRAYITAYRVFGVAMVAVPLGVAAITRLDPASTPCTDLKVFGMEFSGIWVFASFWLLKTIEVHKYGADRRHPNRQRREHTQPL